MDSDLDLDSDLDQPLHVKFITKCDKCYYKVRQLVLLESAMVCYYKVRQLFYYKVRQVLLQSWTGITKCDSFITKCDTYYKVRQNRVWDGWVQPYPQLYKTHAKKQTAQCAMGRTHPSQDTMGAR